MNILFLVPYPENESPSQRYRLEQYLVFLRQNGIGYDYKSFLSRRAWKIFFTPGNYVKKSVGLLTGFIRRWLQLFSVFRYDYVYIHREVAPIGPPLFEWIIAKVFRKKIIYDFDDAIWIPTYSEYNRFAKYFKGYGKVKRICKWAYKVSAGNDYLAAYASKFNNHVTVVPTVVDTENVHRYSQDQGTGHPAIGWTGTFSTLVYLDIVLPVLQRLQEKIDFTFIVIADKDPKLDLKKYLFVKWDKEREAEDLLRMHIGLMPLYDTDFAKGKCGFKAIQYMSMGIPAVVSPVGVNSVIVDHSLNGFVCANDKEWEKVLTDLLTDAGLRMRLGAEARKKIESGYSVRATLETFQNLFR